MEYELGKNLEEIHAKLDAIIDYLGEQAERINAETKKEERKIEIKEKDE